MEGSRGVLLCTLPTHTDRADGGRGRHDGGSLPPMPQYACQRSRSPTMVALVLHTQRFTLSEPLHPWLPPFTPLVWPWLMPTWETPKPCFTTPSAPHQRLPSPVPTWELPRLCSSNTSHPISMAPAGNYTGDSQPNPTLAPSQPKLSDTQHLPRGCSYTSLPFQDGRCNLLHNL